MDTNDYLLLLPEDLHEVLFDPPFFGERPFSKLHQSDFTPIIARLELGQIVQAKDPTERLFKVFLYPSHRRSEIWSAKEWDESLSKRIRSVNQSAEDIRAFQQAKEKYDALSAYVTNTLGIPADNASHRRLVSAFAKLSHVPAELHQFEGLLEIIQKYGNPNDSQDKSEGA